MFTNLNLCSGKDNLQYSSRDSPLYPVATINSYSFGNLSIICDIIARLLIGKRALLTSLVSVSKRVPRPADNIKTAGVLCSPSIFPSTLLVSSSILITSSTSGVDTSCKIMSVNAITLCFLGGVTLKYSPALIIFFSTTPLSFSNQISASPEIMKLVSFLKL